MSWLDPKSALRSENTRSAAAELGVNENTIREASAQAPTSLLWFVPPKDALGEVVDAAMVSGEPMRRGKEQRELPFKIRQQPHT